MRSKVWLATRVSLRLARLPCSASSAQRSRRLRSTRAAAPVLLAHADVTKNIIFFQYFSMDEKLRYPAVCHNACLYDCCFQRMIAQDSLVFGGNFLHSLNIRTQLQVLEGEKRIGLPKRFRVPAYTALMWYVVGAALKVCMCVCMCACACIVCVSCVYRVCVSFAVCVVQTARSSTFEEALVESHAADGGSAVEHRHASGIRVTMPALANSIGML
jgi:hypothetical protein